jgi:hypothetical protein
MTIGLMRTARSCGAGRSHRRVTSPAHGLPSPGVFADLAGEQAEVERLADVGAAVDDPDSGVEVGPLLEHVAVKPQPGRE